MSTVSINSNADGRKPIEVPDRLGTVLTYIAQLLVVAALFTSVWGMGGYFPVPRFIVLTFLTTGCVFVFFGGLYSSKQFRPAIPLLLVALAYLSYGLLQQVPDTAFGFLDWTGVREIQNQFAPAQTDVPRSQSLVRWMTQDWLAMGTIALLGYFLSASVFNNDKSRILLLGSVAICGVGQVLWAVIQVSTYPDDIFWGVENPFKGGAAFGTFLNRNHSADFIGMSLACAFGLARWRLASDTQKWHSGYGVTSHFRAIISNPITLAIWLAVVGLIAGLVLSLSRGGWASVVIAMILVPILWKRKSRNRSLLAVAAVLVSVLSAYSSIQFFGFGDRVDSRVDALEVDTVLTDPRFDHWAEALPAAKHFLPFGSGVGTYGYTYTAFDPEPERGWFTHAHNQYLEVLVEAGIPGILLLLLALFITVRAGLRLCSSYRSVTKQAIGVAMFGSVIIQAFHAVTDFGLMMPGNLLAFSVLLGAACAASGKPQRRRRRQPQESSSVRMASPSVSSEPEPKIEADSVKNLAPESKLHQFTVPALAVSVLCCGGLALWQQGRLVRAKKVLARTKFAPSTPSPTVEKAADRVAELEAELERWPEYEPLLRRTIQLRLHRAQRATYDQIRAANQDIDPLGAWDASSLESVVVRLFDDSGEPLSGNVRADLVTMMQAEPNLLAAWNEIPRALSLNPVHPRTHMRMAQVGAASGREWRDPFERSMKLSVTDPKQSLGNGLLAWAAGDRESMIQQWRSSLRTDWAPIETIHRLAGTMLTEDEIVQELMPSRWVVPFRLSQQLKQNGQVNEFTMKLLDRAGEIAENTLSDVGSRERTLGIIAIAKGDSLAAIGHYEKAVESQPRDPELRHLLAQALYQSGQTKQAVSEARIATLLAPKSHKFRDTHQRFLRLHRRQYSQKLENTNEPSRPQPN